MSNELPQATAADPVCGMTVQVPDAVAKGLYSRHEDQDYVFCGRGCKLDFDEDPDRYLDPLYVPSM
jgi:YHS domain-containing protein